MVLEKSETFFILKMQISVNVLSQNKKMSEKNCGKKFYLFFFSPRKLVLRKPKKPELGITYSRCFNPDLALIHSEKMWLFFCR